MRALFVIVFSVLIAGCALRPRYRDLANGVPPENALRIQLIDPEGGMPIAGAKVQMGERMLDDRMREITGADGIVVIPHKKRYWDDNSMLIVDLPPGVSHYRVQLAPAVIRQQAPVTPEPAVDAPPPPPPAPSETK